MNKKNGAERNNRLISVAEREVQVQMEDGLGEVQSR